MITFNKKDITYLLKHYHIDEIERGVIQFFLKTNKIKKIKNKFLMSFINSGDPAERREIEDFFSLKNIKFDLKQLIRFFELLIEPKWRKLNGAFYTPQFIVDYINDKVIRKNPHIKVCDPACGSGAFLIDATEKISRLNRKSIVKTIEENIYGVDIDPRSVKRTKLILSLLCLINKEDKEEINFNIKVGDSLDPEKFNWQKEFSLIFRKGGFDGVIGNPPYVRIQNLEKETKEKIQKNWETASEGNIDLFIPFFELGINLLNKNGILGYITPNSYFTSFAGRRLREFLSKNTYIKEIIDFNHLQIFEDVRVYCAITILDKKKKKDFVYALCSEPTTLPLLKALNFQKIKYSTLDNKKWVLLSGNDYYNIRRIETVGKKLGEICRISTGLATLADSLYILNNPMEENGYYLKEYNGKIYKIEKEITKEIIKANVIKSEKDILKNKRRIIFPYKLVNGRYEIIPEKELKQNYPCCYRYFLAIRKELSKRDKGKKRYVAWYAYGRTQGINSSFGKKILTPTMSLKPNFVICNKKNATFYGGYGIFYKGNLLFLKKILNSQIMDYYITKTSKFYAGGYKSFTKTFLKNFSIPDFSESEIKFILKNPQEKVNKFLISKYKLKME
jgi:type I restriction-modification system DNA methylase subunit